jgi:hypothetical protein
MIVNTNDWEINPISRGKKRVEELCPNIISPTREEELSFGKTSLTVGTAP